MKNTTNSFSISDGLSGTTLSTTGTTGYATTSPYWGGSSIIYSGAYIPQPTMRKEVGLSLKFTDNNIGDKEFYKKVYRLQQAIKDLGWEIESIDTNITKR